MKLDFETWGFQFWLPICRDIWNQKDLLHTGPSGSVNACVGVILMFHSVCCISLVSYNACCCFVACFYFEKLLLSTLIFLIKDIINACSASLLRGGKVRQQKSHGAGTQQSNRKKQDGVYSWISRKTWYFSMNLLVELPWSICSMYILYGLLTCSVFALVCFKFLSLILTVNKSNVLLH